MTSGGGVSGEESPSSSTHRRKTVLRVTSAGDDSRCGAMLSGDRDVERLHAIVITRVRSAAIRFPTLRRRWVLPTPASAMTTAPRFEPIPERTALITVSNSTARPKNGQGATAGVITSLCYPAAIRRRSRSAARISPSSTIPIDAYGDASAGCCTERCSSLAARRSSIDAA